MSRKESSSTTTKVMTTKHINRFFKRKKEDVHIEGTKGKYNLTEKVK